MTTRYDYSIPRPNMDTASGTLRVILSYVDLVEQEFAVSNRVLSKVEMVSSAMDMVKVVEPDANQRVSRSAPLALTRHLPSSLRTRAALQIRVWWCRHGTAPGREFWAIVKLLGFESTVDRIERGGQHGAGAASMTSAEELAGGIRELRLPDLADTTVAVHSVVQTLDSHTTANDVITIRV